MEGMGKMRLGEYIRFKWKKFVFVGVCLLLLGTAQTELVPYVMERWSHDRRIGILHILFGICFFAAGAAGLILFYRKEYTGHGKKWKEELARLSAVYLLVQCIAGTGAGAAGVLLYRGGRVSYEDTKTVLYFLNILWQNLFRAGLVCYRVKRLHGRDWRKDWIEDWKKNRRKKAKEAGCMCVGAAAFTALGLLPDGPVWRVFMGLLAAVYILAFAAYGSYRAYVSK